MNEPSDPDEIFSKASKVVKFADFPTEFPSENEDKQTILKESKLIKTKKTVPSNITCHCAGIHNINQNFSLNILKIV